MTQNSKRVKYKLFHCCTIFSWYYLSYMKSKSQHIRHLGPRCLNVSVDSNAKIVPKSCPVFCLILEEPRNFQCLNSQVPLFSGKPQL